MDASDGTAVQALLDEQAALRRVATLVASAGDPARVFSTVTAEVGGLHPAILSDHGLEPATRSLIQRAPLPVELTFEASERPSDAVEVAA
jgi:hypothetical protein